MPVRRSLNSVPESDLAALLKRYEAGTKVDEQGTLQFCDLDFDELERIVADAYEGDRAFTARQLRELLRRALRDCRMRGDLTPSALLDEARTVARQLVSIPVRPFAMWTKFRARSMPFASGFKLKVDGVSLEATCSLPRYMHVNEYFLSGHGRILPDEPVFFGYLIARCEARDANKAVADMLDATELFMAVYNLYELSGKWTHGDRRWAQGKLWHGPYHFLFENRRFLGHDHLWYNPTYDGEDWGIFPTDMVTVLRFLPRVRRALAALAEHPLREVLVKVLRLMQNAMASRDQSYSLLRYWSALEQLYGEPGSREKNYTRIIQRASFAETDRLIARWKLTHIARLRNEYVHAGDNDDDIQVMSQYLRMLLTRHFNYLLFHAPQIKSHKQWLEIVDLPADEALLAQRKAAIDHRLAIIDQGRQAS